MSNTSQGEILFPGVTIEGGFIPADALQDLDASGRISARGARRTGNANDFLDPTLFDIFPPDTLEASCQRAFDALRPRWLQFDRFRGQVVPRWLSPLLHELHLGHPSPVTLRLAGNDSREYQFSGLHGSVPLLLVDHTQELDKPFRGKATPHGHMQEFLNKSKDHLFGIVSNGMELRLLRDNARLTRQAYLSFDLAGMFSGGEYASFSLLYRLLHGSRFRVGEGQRPEDCLLEGWLKQAGERTARAMEHLRDGVRKAIEELGKGFLLDPGIVTSLREEKYSSKAFNHEILRLVYRLIFLLVAEERDLLFAPEVQKDDARRQIYLQGYSASRLRELARRTRGSGHRDLYESLKTTCAALADTSRAGALGLTPLGGLFNARQGDQLPIVRLPNDCLLAAMRLLTLREVDGQVRPVDYLRLGAEELGSVYEQLLELEPFINLDNPTQPVFEINAAGGNDRKTTGSYYTPECLVQCVLDSALDPVMAQATTGKTGEEAAQALLKLTICDPACGSGHFLVGAGRRLAQRVAEYRAGGELPGAEQVRHAFRQVAAHCLYGVDINEMAIELAKIALWMEAMEPGKPLSFLDHHFRVGNSLLGTTPRLLKQGIPEDAFNPISGDDKEICSSLKRINREDLATSNQSDFQFGETLGDKNLMLASLESGQEETLEEVREKENQYKKIQTENDYRTSGRLLADAWCAAFVWHKKNNSEGSAIPCPTTATLREIVKRPHGLSLATFNEIRRLAGQYHFLHWHLEFPNIFRRIVREEETGNKNIGCTGGFDVILGNPPWETTELQEKQFFASASPEIAEASNAKIRKQLILELKQREPDLYANYLDTLRLAGGTSHIARHSGLFSLTGQGRINSYALFIELSYRLISTNGRMGIIIPTGVATDETLSDFFSHFVSTKRLARLIGFENEEFLFPGVANVVRFCIFVATGGAGRETATFAFYIRRIEQLSEEVRYFTLSANEIAELNPNTKTCPLFRTKEDANLTTKIHRTVPIMVCDAPYENSWGIELKKCMFNTTSDARLFESSPSSDRECLYEAKLFWHFDHRFGSYDLVGTAKGKGGRGLPHQTLANYQNPSYRAIPRFWVHRTEVESRLPLNWKHRWLIGLRDITSAKLERTCVSTILPRTASGDVPLLFPHAAPTPHHIACLLANLNSIIFDYIVRQKLGGSHLSLFILKQIPLIPPESYDAASVEYISRRVVELVYTAEDMADFASDMGFYGAPFRWDFERRRLLRAELDVAYARLYMLNRSELKFVLDPQMLLGDSYPGESFRVLKEKELLEFGTFRTRDEVLASWDATQTAHPPRGVHASS